jgi:hypothetical protein
LCPPTEVNVGEPAEIHIEATDQLERAAVKPKAPGSGIGEEPIAIHQSVYLVVASSTRQDARVKGLAVVPGSNDCVLTESCCHGSQVSRSRLIVRVEE